MVYRPNAYKRTIEASLRESLSTDWTDATSSTTIPRQTHRGTTVLLNGRLDYCNRRKSPCLMEEVDDVINVPRETLWAQAMLFACDVTNKFVTTSKEREKTPHESWFGTTSTPEYFRPFRAVGYARRKVRKLYKMATKRKKCVFMGIPGH